MKDYKKSVYLRWLFTNSTAWNYENYQGLGYCAAMIPSLKEIYKDDPEGLHQSIGMHMQFFNTNATTGAAILGATLAMEEQSGAEAIEAVRGIKVGLMGALAGVGDTLFSVLPNTIIGAIGAYLALEGIWWGALLFPLFYVTQNFLVYYIVKLGYTEGTNLITKMSGQLRSLTNAANTMGIMVVGALIPSVVHASTGLVFEMGEVTQNLQDILDMILPGLLPMLIVLFAYLLLGIKKINSTHVIFILLLSGIILHAANILA